MKLNSSKKFNQLTLISLSLIVALFITSCSDTLSDTTDGRLR